MDKLKDFFIGISQNMAWDIIKYVLVGSLIPFIIGIYKKRKQKSIGASDATSISKEVLELSINKKRVMVIQCALILLLMEIFIGPYPT